MFLVPATTLFGALGVAHAEPLKTLVSLMGVVTSSVWVARVVLWRALSAVDRSTAFTLACVFATAWIVALVAHAWRWYHGL